MQCEINLTASYQTWTMTLQSNLTDIESDQVDACHTQWNGVPFNGNQQPWQTLEIPSSLPMPEHLFAELGIDLPMLARSDAQQMLADEDFDSSDVLSQDCILTPPAFKIDTRLNWADAPVRLWPRSFPPSLEPSPISPTSTPQDAMQGSRKEVRTRFLWRVVA